MGFWKNLFSLFGGGGEEVIKNEIEEFEATPPPKNELPMNGGRSSQPSDFTVFGAIMNGGLQIQNDVTLSQYKLIEKVVRTKPDPSQAANNIVLLGGQKIDIIFPSTMSKIKQRQAAMVLNELRKNLYNGGENSLVSDLLFQLATYGALSAEMVLLDNLSGVKTVTKLS